MGAQGYHVVYLDSPEPISLRQSQKSDICDKCREAEYSSTGMGIKRVGAASKDSGAPPRKSPSPDDHIGKDLGSGAGEQLHNLKRELLITLLRKKGSFYEAVHDMRLR